MSNKSNNVPEWSSQLAEKLLSPIVVHDNKKDDQFQEYIDRHFTGNEAKLLKNRLSETPTLRNSTSFPQDVEKSYHHPPPVTAAAAAAAAEGSDDDSRVWWVAKEDQDGFYSICGLLFLLGFVCPPCWWVGSFWPRQVREKGGKMAHRWQKLNRIMSIGFSTILIILIIVLAVLYAKK